MSFILQYLLDALVEIVAKILALVPPWVRVYRIQRDIPMPLVTSGVDNGNLRELALNKMKDMNIPCRDVRTREVGIKEVHHKIKPEQIELIRRDYYANGGWETFLSYEDPKQDILVGLLRLRKCADNTFRPELVNKCSLVRELHVYGSVVPIHSRDPTKFQHQVIYYFFERIIKFRALGQCLWKKQKELLEMSMDQSKWLLYLVLVLDITIGSWDMNLKVLIWLSP